MISTVLGDLTLPSFSLHIFPKPYDTAFCISYHDTSYYHNTFYIEALTMSILFMLHVYYLYRLCKQ